MAATNPQTTVRVPPELLQKARIEAARSGKSLQELWLRGLELAIIELREKRKEKAA